MTNRVFTERMSLQAWWWSEECYLKQDTLKTGNSCVIKQEYVGTL